MSAYHQIFLRTTKSENEMIDDLNLATGADINAVEPPSDSIAYFGRVRNTVVEVELQHEFEEDFGMDFSAYPVVVTIRELNTDVQTEEQVARSVFERLSAIGGYDLLLVFNLQRLLAKT